jgi:diphthamide synthase (EF-2-diphthine--ammonia ligase)
MVDSGLRAVVTAVDLAQAPARLAGSRFDHEFLSGLPAAVDPCGERGEFHTFVTDGPGFAGPVDVTVERVVQRDGFAVAVLGTRRRR